MISLRFNFDKQFEKRYKDNPKYKDFMEFHDSEENKIGDEFLSFRISKGLTQQKMSEYLELSLNTYI